MKKEVIQKATLGGLKEKEATAFMKAYVHHHGPEATFWQQLQKDPDWKDHAHLDQLQAVFQLATLTGGDLPLVEQLIKTKKIKSIADIKQLAALDHSDWAALKAEKPAKTGKQARSKALSAKEPDTGKNLTATFAKAFPTTAFAARLQKDKNSKLPHREAISHFLQNHDDFDLLHTRVGKFLDEKKHALSAKEAPEVANQLRRMQRVFRLAPDYGSVHTLMGDNVHSAHQVVKMGRENFIRTYGDALGEKEAGKVFEKAGQVHAATIALVGNLKSMTDASALNVFPDFGAAINETLVQELPDLEMLFGHTDFCACDECNAVYGAPAYLTDILHFLEERNSVVKITGKSGHGLASVKDLLLQRRPDIGDIDLECANSNTSIPFIDIACEIMEDYIAPPVITIPSSLLPKLVKGVIDASLLTAIKTQLDATGQSHISPLLTANATLSAKYNSGRLGTDNTYAFDESYMIRDNQVALKAIVRAGGIDVRVLHQTLAGEEALSTGPQIINANVYNNFLKTAKRPFSLPFDLFDTEGAMYLEKLGMQRSGLIDTFRKSNQLTRGAAPEDTAMAYAALGINEAEQTLIFQPDPTHQSLYWGSVADDTVIQVHAFEKLSGLNYEQVVMLVQCAFINPAKDSLIEHDDLLSGTTHQRITHITPAKLDAMHRFLRLWRKTGFTLFELDAIVMSIGQGNINPAFAFNLHQFMQVQRTLQLGAFELLAFYTNIDTTYNLPDCLYNRLFQNSALTNPLHPDFAISKVMAGNIALTAEHKNIIAAVLRITQQDLNDLLPFGTPLLTLPLLSLLYRHAQLATTTGIPVHSLRRLRNIIPVDPFSGPAVTLSFLQLYSLLQFSGFSIAEIDYVLNHHEEPDQPLAPSDSQVMVALTQLQDELQVIDTATHVDFDPHGELLSKWLTDPLLQWDLAQVSRLIDLLNTVDDEDYTKKVENNYSFLLDLSLPGAGKMFINTAEIDNALKVLTAGHMADRFALFLNKVAPVYRRLQQQTLLINDISTWFKADKKIVTQLLTSVPGIFTDLTEPAFNNETSSNLTVQIDRYQFLAKTCFLVNKLKMSAEALSFLVKYGTNIGCLDLLNLPVGSHTVITPPPLTTGNGKVKALPVAAAVDPELISFAGFEKLVNLVRFERSYAVSIYTVLGEMVAVGLTGNGEPGAVKTQLLVQLSAVTGWNHDELVLLTGQLFNSKDDFKQVIPFLQRLHLSFAALQQLGITATDAISWCKPSLTIADTAAIRQKLKSKYSNPDWTTVTVPLQNTLREKKRDALIAYLLANPGTQPWTTDNDLYSYFLLDVEMCSCQLTSRIIQATNSVQLFVQRCQMALEPTVVVDLAQDSLWKQWQWMKNFRVWQANVKVFLYPENFVEPELLPKEIKSPFLKELENDLLQQEVTAIAAEDAFHNYLKKLDGVARLEVKAMWYDHPTQTLHVFARTFGGNPRTWYYRRLINERRWTPWEKVDLDITSDHILPAVYRNRLYLFWAVFTEEAEMPDTITLPNANDPKPYKIEKPNKSWTIQLAFSEYKGGKWTPKQISENNAGGRINVGQTSFPDKEKFVLTALDIPAFDYSHIFKQDGSHFDTQEDFNKKVATAVRENGKLIISCYYFTVEGQTDFDHCKYVGSFQLDPVKGYPTHLTVNYSIVLPQSGIHFERSSRNSRLINMLDTETFAGPNPVTPPSPGIPGAVPGKVLVSEEGGGPFSNLIPLQWTVLDRVQFMNNIYNNGNKDTFKVESLVGQQLPYFYQDQRRSYYVVSEFSDNGAVEFLYSQFLDLTFTLLEDGEEAFNAKLLPIINVTGPLMISRYFNFHHPLVDYFVQQLFMNGIDGLMDRKTQLKGDAGFGDGSIFDFQVYFQPVIAGFESIYSGSKTPVTYPNGYVDQFPGYPKDDVDFNLQSGYGLYNWELFFHAPLMIAERLSQNQQFEDAYRWYNYIFNPTDLSPYPAPDKYWNTKPFFINANEKYIKQRIEKILSDVNTGGPDNEGLIKDVEDWRANPFQPHFIAQTRTVAYQKAVVMKYVAHLIRHGDFLFRQHTMESVNEATQLYILAAEILGPKPEIIPSPAKTPVSNYYQLEQQLDAMSNAMVNIENLLPQQSIKDYTGTIPNDPKLIDLKSLYFCIPMNEKLAGAGGYWDVVADRLFKIRHCMDIDGNAAPLALFSAPIDPGALVRAASAGLDIGSVLNDVNGPLPLYRFMVMIQKANELCNEVKVLGGLLLSVLEKKDGETMALLRSQHEMKLLKAVLQVKQKQIDEAQNAVDNLQKQRELVLLRQQYYDRLLVDGLTNGEETALDLNKLSFTAEALIAMGYVLAGGLFMIPAFALGISGFGGSPHGTTEISGDSFGMSTDAAVKTLSSIAAASDKLASILTTQSGYDRRAAEWKQQSDLAGKELEQINVQSLGARIRLDIAKKDLENQQLQIDQSQEMDDFMRSKFTNEELFTWMSTQVSNTYFKSYQLAYETAKRAERSFRYELSLTDSAFINFGYWDSLKKGLLAGEQLSYDLRRLELAYLEQNKRELELVKHISLSQLDPVALMKLKTNGECWINLPEELFDMDYPGHYMRRIKTVSLSIPCITGPYTTVSCTLTMTNSSMRINNVSAADAAQYPRKQLNGVPADDPRFRDMTGALQSIATSNAQNDSGLFELNFRDDRYLPFEGAGAISVWHLQLPAAVRQFDYNTISDVIIHLKYTARNGGDALAANATTHLNAKINEMLVSLKDRGLMRIISAKHDLPTEWYRFLHPANATGDQVLTVNLDKSKFPLFTQGRTVKIRSIELIADSSVQQIDNIQVTPAGEPPAISLTATNKYAGCLSATVDYSNNTKDMGVWLITKSFTTPEQQVTDSMLNNLVIIVHYEVS